MEDGKKTDNKNENVAVDNAMEGELAYAQGKELAYAQGKELLPIRRTMTGDNNYEIMSERKNGEKRAEEVLASNLGGMAFKTTDPETGHELPIRTLYQGRKLRLSKSRMWLLQSFGGFTVEEITAFQRKYSKELTIDETEVIGLYLRALSGDREAKLLLWDLNKEIFKATRQVYIEQMKAEFQQEQNRGQTRMESMLEQIGQKIMESNEKLSKKEK